jgi:hypothetical protein
MNQALYTPVFNRGSAPDNFLQTCISVVAGLPDEVFAVNANDDIYALLFPTLGPWDGTVIQRKAAMLEAMRVHAGFESSWIFGLGLDTTNPDSVNDPRQAEAGAFQISFDSLDLDPSGGLATCLARYGTVSGPETFQTLMKATPALQVEYYARLVRIGIQWAGPLIDPPPNSIIPWLSRDAMAAFQQGLTPIV